MKDKIIYMMFLKQFKRRMLIMLAIITGWLIIDFLKLYKMYISDGPKASTGFETGYILCIIFLIVIGFWYSYKQYPGLLGIQAKRETYLLNILLIGTAGSMLMMTLCYGISQLISSLAKASMAKWIILDGFPFSLAGLVSYWGIGLVGFSGSFMAGAVLYRLNTMTAVCVLGILPISLLISILAYFYFQNDASMIWAMIMLSIAKPMIGGPFQIVYIFFFWTVGCLLLVHAPIKAYAHDLL